MPGPENTGVIHDIGYQRYEGPRLGRGYASRSLFVHSVRGAYGLGRSAWAKVLPFGCWHRSRAWPRWCSWWSTRSCRSR